MIKVPRKKFFSREKRGKKKRKRVERGKFTRALEEGLAGRWALGAFIFIVSVLVISWRGMPIRLPSVGGISERDVIATCDFSFPDRARTEGEREAAVNRQPVAYRVDRSISTEKAARLEDFLRRFRSPGLAPRTVGTGLFFAPPAWLSPFFSPHSLRPTWKRKHWQFSRKPTGRGSWPRISR